MYQAFQKEEEDLDRTAEFVPFSDPDSSKTTIIPAVVGGTLGSAAFVTIVIVALVMFCRWKPEKGRVNAKNAVLIPSITHCIFYCKI